MAARCLPRRRRARPARAPVPLVLGAARSTLASPSSGGFVQAAVDAYARTGHRPAWLSDELLAVLEARGRLVGLVYLLHFDRPIGGHLQPAWVRRPLHREAREFGITEGALAGW
jgi:hypothetical protein